MSVWIAMNGARRSGTLVLLAPAHRAQLPLATVVRGHRQHQGALAQIAVTSRASHGDDIADLARSVHGARRSGRDDRLARHHVRHLRGSRIVHRIASPTPATAIAATS